MSTQQFTVNAETRTTTGKGANRRLRRLDDKIPGVIYGGEEQPHFIMVDHKKMMSALENEGFYSHILTVQIDGKPQRAILKDLHRHPYKRKLLHVDFLRITGKEKITMHIPLHFKGEDKAPGVVMQGGILTHATIEVEISCLPDHLPEFIEVDISHLELDQTIHLSELKVPKNVELVALSHGNDMPVATIHMPRIEKEPEPIVEEVVEGALEAAEGEAPAATTEEKPATE